MMNDERGTPDSSLIVFERWPAATAQSIQFHVVPSLESRLNFGLFADYFSLSLLPDLLITKPVCLSNKRMEMMALALLDYPTRGERQFR